MLGINTSTLSTDDAVTLNTYYGWSYGQDVINGVIHEISEGGMGRIGGLGGSGGGDWAPMDLFRYNASGNPDYTNGRDGDTTYFSSNGGSALSDEGLPNKGAPTLSYHNQYDPSDNVYARRQRRLEPRSRFWHGRNGRNTDPDPDRTRRHAGARLESLAEAGRRRNFRQLGDPDRLEHRLHADRAAGRI